MPCVFAEKMHLSRSQLYNVLDVVKNFDAPLKYCRKKESFYYEFPFDLELNYSLKIILDEEIREI